MTSDAIASAFQAACLAELDALKPGNVHRHAESVEPAVSDFERSAAAAAPAISAQGLTVGQRIEEAVRATRAAVSHNTNLGIVLLAAPLAQAALTATNGSLRLSLAEVLAALTVDDARCAYRAIRMAEPGGLGNAPEHDVATDPSPTLLDAMRAAATRPHRLELCERFRRHLRLGTNWREGGINRWGDVPSVATYIYLGFLAHVPDTLIERKFGPHVAAEVLDEARPINQGWLSATTQKEMMRPLIAFRRFPSGNGVSIRARQPI